MATNSKWQRIVSYALPVFLWAGCGGGTPEATPEELFIPLTTETKAPTSWVTLAPAVTPRASRQGGLLRIISPLESTQMSGGESLRIALYLVDPDDQQVEGATVHAELWHPSGELFANLPCGDKGEGRYLSEYLSLPLQETSGTWQVISTATWKEGQQATAESTFQVMPSISEMYKNRYGFWIEHPHIFGLGTGFYNLHETGGLHFEDWLNEDGSGFVILDNYRYIAIGVTFATLEVHWQSVDFPTDGAAAIAFAESLARPGLHHQDPDTPLTKLSAETVTFQGRSAWQVMGLGSEYYVSKAAAEYSVEWLIFQCPGSDWLWSLVIATDNVGYLNQLREVQKSFDCPPVKIN